MDPYLFVGPKFKIERAKRHINELHHVINAFSKTDFYSAGMEENPDTGAYIFSVKMTSQMPAEIPLSMGDAIHNMRFSLDHLATGIVRAANMRANDVYFPFDETRQNLVARLEKGPIKQACPGIENVILDEIRPYRGGKTPLWELNKLDNIDKHNLLVPAIYASHVSVDTLEAENGMVMRHCLISVGPGGQINPIGSGSKIKVNGNVYPRFEVSFPKGGPFEDEPVLPTLAQCAEFVSQAINIIENFMKTVGGPAAASA